MLIAAHDVRASVDRSVRPSSLQTYACRQSCLAPCTSRPCSRSWCSRTCSSSPRRHHVHGQELEVQNLDHVLIVLVGHPCCRRRLAAKHVGSYLIPFGYGLGNLFVFIVSRTDPSDASSSCNGNGLDVTSIHQVPKVRVFSVAMNEVAGVYVVDLNAVVRVILTSSPLTFPG